MLSWVSILADDEGFGQVPGNKTPVHRMALLPNGDILCARCTRKVYIKKFLGVS